MSGMKMAGLEAFLQKNPGIAAGARGTALGFGAFSVAALVNDVLEMLEDRKKAKKRNNPGVSSDTIVINIPRSKEIEGVNKLGSARDSFVEVDKKKDDSRDDGTNKYTWKQSRNADGTFASGWEFSVSNGLGGKAEKCAQNTNPPKEQYKPQYFEGGFDKALALSLGVSGVGLGWVLADKVHDFIKKKRLKREIAAAQKEYVDFMLGRGDGQKEVRAEAVKVAGQPVSLSKVTALPNSQANIVSQTMNIAGKVVPDVTSQQSLAETGQNMIGLTGGISLLVMAASALLTKKYLDKKFQEANNDKTVQNVPKVNNIVFKTASAEKIEMSPVDALAFVKLSSIVMKKSMSCSDGYTEEKLASAADYYHRALDMAKDVGAQAADGAKKVGTKALDAIGTAIAPEAVGSLYAQADPYDFIDNLFTDVGYEGDDPATWEYKPPRTDYTDNERKKYKAMMDELQNRNDEFLKAFMDDKYKAKREALAQQAVNDWYSAWLGRNPVMKRFDKPIKWIVDAISKLVMRTGYGKRRMWNQIMSNMKNIGEPPVTDNPTQTEVQQDAQ